MVFKKTKKTGIERIWRALGHSFSGLKNAAVNEKAFQQEIVLFIIATGAAMFLPTTGLLKIIIFVCNSMVLIVELLNSSIESIVDKASPEYNELAKHSKDMGSAAVFLSIICCFSVWCYAIYASIFK